MTRKLFLIAGVVVSLAGSIGLVVYGPVLVQVVLVLLGRAEAESVLGDFRLAAAAAMAVALGATLLGFLSQRDAVRLPVSGKATVALAGGILLISGAAILFGTFSTYRGLRQVASAPFPRDSDIAVLVPDGELVVRFGFGLLVVAQCACLAGAATARPAERRQRGSVVVHLAGVTYMIAGWTIAGLFLFHWWHHASSLSSALHSGTPRPAVLLDGVSQVLIGGGVVGLCLLLQAFCLAAIGFSAVRT